MLRRILLPVIFLFLAYGLWLSPDFKQIAAGVAIFLFGMLWLEQGFKTFTGGLLERLLARSTDRLWKSLSFGVVTTTLMQSSSLVSVITISFLSAGLISLGAGIAIVFGANLGTTTGAWIVAAFGLKVKISAYAMPMLVFGVVLVFQRATALKGSGYALAGMGFLFLGIHHMKEGFAAFGDSIDLAAYAIPGFEGLLVYIALGIAATVVMQSSHATLVLTLAALASGQITYENGLGLAIGSNVGTTITAILGSLGSNVDGRRLAVAHLTFNLITGVTAVAAIEQLMAGVSWFSNAVGIAPDDHTLKLAVFHTLFNLIGVTMMVPFVRPLVAWLEKLLPTPRLVYKQPRYINAASIDHPDAAIEAVRKETVRLFGHALTTIVHGLGVEKKSALSEMDHDETLEFSSSLIEEDIDERYEMNTKALYGSIVEFMSLKQDMCLDHAEELHSLRMAGQRIVESIKGVKHLQKNLRLHLASENEALRGAYDAMRKRITRTLREVERAQNGDDASLTTLTLNAAEVGLAEDDLVSSGRLDELIRSHSIDAYVATSLINDNSYTRDICENLLEMGLALFGARDAGLREAEKNLMLDDGEIREHRESLPPDEKATEATEARQSVKSEQLLRKIRGFLDAGHKAQRKQAKSIVRVLGMIRERELKKEQKREPDTGVRRDLERELGVLKAQRKKGAKILERIACSDSH